MTDNKGLAMRLINAMEVLVSDFDKLNNFECYLGYHFDVWFEKFANTPEGLVSEFERFSKVGDDID